MRTLDATLEIVIEQRAGEAGRWEWEPEGDRIVFRHELEPMPAHYGCSVSIVNPADGELLDVILVDENVPERGERRMVRVVDVLERADGDDKLLAVPESGQMALPAGIRDRIWAWNLAIEKPVLRWGGEERALALIKRCRDGAT